MPITFNIDEIFEMAVEIEQNGAQFYRETVGKAKDEDTKKMLLDMATMEIGHVRTFEQMRKEFAEQEQAETVYDPNNEAALYLQAIADSRSSEGKISPTQKLTGKETIKDILEIALNSEKDSVVFYFGLQSLVSDKAGKDKVKEIIMEELSHITILLDRLKTLK